MNTAQFLQDVLARLGAPKTGPSLTALEVMAKGESGGYLTSVNNPLATTRGGQGAYNLPGSVFSSGRNPAGVKGYGTPAEGIAATAATLQQSNFSALLHNLRTGAPLSAYTTGAPAAELRTWQGGSSEDVNNLRAAAGGQKVTVTGQTSGATSGQGGGGSSAQGASSPGSWIGAAAAVPADVAGWLGSLIGTGAGAVAGATAAGVVSGASGAALGSVQGFYAAAKPYVVPLAVALIAAVIITPELTGKRGNPVAITLNEASGLNPFGSSSGSSGGTEDTSEQPPPPPSEPSPPPAPSDQPMTPAQVIQDQVKRGAKSNAAIFREIERRRRNGTLIEDGGSGGGAAAGGAAADAADMAALAA